MLWAKLVWQDFLIIQDFLVLIHPTDKIFTFLWIYLRNLNTHLISLFNMIFTHLKIHNFDNNAYSSPPVMQWPLYVLTAVNRTDFYPIHSVHRKVKVPMLAVNLDCSCRYTWNGRNFLPHFCCFSIIPSCTGWLISWSKLHNRERNIHFSHSMCWANDDMSCHSQGSALSILLECLLLIFAIYLMNAISCITRALACSFLEGRWIR